MKRAALGLMALFFTLGVRGEGNVLVRQDGVAVTLEDFQALLQGMPPTVRGTLETDEEAIRKAVGQLFVIKSLAREAKGLGLDRDPMVQKRIELEVDKLLAQVRLAHLEQEAKLPDFETLAKEEYLAHPEKYRIPEKVRVSHILIGIEGRGEEEARKLAEKVRRLALEGKPFEELALEYSEDPSVKRNKGDLGFVTKGRMVKPFEEAAFALKEPGEISPVIKTRYGFHVIRLEERKPGRQLAFEEVKDDIIQRLKGQYLARLKEEHIAKIRSAPDIEVNQEAIEALVKPIPKERHQP